MTPVRVVAEGEEPEPEVRTSGPQSPLELLRGKREALDATLFRDYIIPRWEDVLDRQLWVRYKPANPAYHAARTIAREQAHLEAVGKHQTGDPDWSTMANADLLVDSCLAIFDLAVGEEPPKDLPPGDYPTFSSPELADALGAPSRNAAATVRKAYGTDADLLIAATQLLNWSGQVSKDAETDFLDR